MTTTNNTLYKNSPCSRRVIIVLIIMIIMQSCLLVYLNAVKKDGFNTDEVWSYGLANSYYQPFLYDRYETGATTYINAWHDGSVLRDYLTVQNGERFSYDSVFYNQSEDVHPPLYYCLLHTICSFFPDSFSKWYGFSINLCCFVASACVLFLLLRLLTRSDLASLFGVALWGFSVGAQNCFLLLRMYGLLTLIALIFAYFQVKLLMGGSLKKCLPPLAITLVLGALTHYFFIPFAGIISAIVCITMMLRKQWKPLAIYAPTLVASLLLAFAIFPASLNHIFHSTGQSQYIGVGASGQHATLGLQLHFIIRYLLNELTGLKITLMQTAAYSYVIAVIVILTAVIAPLCYVFRKDTWFKRIASAVNGSLGHVFLIIKSGVLSIDKRRTLSVFLLLVSAGTVIATATLLSPISTAKEFASRYFSWSYPLLIAALVSLALAFVRWLNINRRISISLAGLLVCGAVILSNLQNTETYFFHPYNVNPEYSADIVSKDSNCIIILTNDEKSKNEKHDSGIQIITQCMSECKRFFFVCDDEASSFYDEFNEATGEQTYLFIYQRTFLADTGTELLGNQISSDNGEEVIYLTYEEVFENNVYLKTFIENTNFTNFRFVNKDSEFYIFELT